MLQCCLAAGGNSNSHELVNEIGAQIQAAQKDIDNCLYWAGGLPFERHSPEMKDATVKTVESIGQIMSKYPALGLRIYCFVGPELEEQQATSLSSGRALAVKDVLLDAGIKNLLHSEGKGCADKVGARIELRPCDPRKINSLFAQIQAAQQSVTADSADQGQMCNGGKDRMCAGGGGKDRMCSTLTEGESCTVQ